MIDLRKGDCLELMKTIPDKSINLVLIDPPYNIKKAKWDKWKTVNEYVKFMGKVFLEIQRILKDNGSFYFFHNDFLQMVELQNFINKNTDFIFKQLLVWNKRYNGSPRKYYFDNVIAGNTNRNHRQLSEYCLYYTFQDETGLTTVKLDTNNFPTLRKYFKELQEYLGLSLKKVNETLGHRKAEHCFYWKTTQWDLPTKETYRELIDVFQIDKWVGFREYEDLRQEYEELRYTFNNQKTHHDVLDFEVAKKQGHITPKPVDLLEYIIKTSSNENDVVLDCFMGSGSTGVACLNTNRNFIGIELDDGYFKIAKERINNTLNKECVF